MPQLTPPLQILLWPQKTLGNFAPKQATSHKVTLSSTRNKQQSTMHLNARSEWMNEWINEWMRFFTSKAQFFSFPEVFALILQFLRNPMGCTDRQTDGWMGGLTDGQSLPRRCVDTSKNCSLGSLIKIMFLSKTNNQMTTWSPAVRPLATVA